MNDIQQCSVRYRDTEFDGLAGLDDELFYQFNQSVMNIYYLL